MSSIFDALVIAAVAVCALAAMDFLFADQRNRWSLRTYLLIVLGIMLAIVIVEAVIGP